ncbi:hypothetical protein L6452_00436 [Arctium lappa]|uniref:Uncharacterized protein n=1 Tax=Arctium lappa TaxID=4217 RepID=A0ACB9FDV2_ARCLA|nr:hypothetical protein L6452_00436 [Arctium lappa]
MVYKAKSREEVVAGAARKKEQNVFRPNRIPDIEGRRDSRKYSEVVKGASTTCSFSEKQVPGDKSFPYVEERSLQVITDPNLQEMLSRSIIGEVKKLEFMEDISELCKTEGLSSFDLKYLGGKEVLLVMENEETVNNILEVPKHGIRQWIWNLRKWDSSYKSEGRLTWINILGVPVQCWTNSVFISIAEWWGTVIETRNCSALEAQSLVMGKVCIHAIDTNPIEESLEIKHGNCTFKIRVSEDAKEILEMCSEETSSEYDSDGETCNSKDEFGNGGFDAEDWDDDLEVGSMGKKLEDVQDSHSPIGQPEVQLKNNPDRSENYHSSSAPTDQASPIPADQTCMGSSKVTDSQSPAEFGVPKCLNINSVDGPSLNVGPTENSIKIDNVDETISGFQTSVGPKQNTTVKEKPKNHSHCSEHRVSSSEKISFENNSLFKNTKINTKVKGVNSRGYDLRRGKLSMRMLKEMAREKYGSKSSTKCDLGSRKFSGQKASSSISVSSGGASIRNHVLDSLSAHDSEKAQEVGAQIGFIWKDKQGVGGSR